MMKIVLLFILTMATSGQALACDVCAENNKLAATFKLLNYGSSIEQERGMDQIEFVKRRVSISTMAIKKDKKHRTQIFSTLVDLVIVSAPFDFESQGAQMLQDVMNANPDLRAQFDRTMGKKILTCQEKLVKNSIEEFSCDDRLKKSGKVKPGENHPSCVRPFNFDTCRESEKASGQ